MPCAVGFEGSGTFRRRIASFRASFGPVSHVAGQCKITETAETIIAHLSRAISFPRTLLGAPSAREMFLSAVLQAVKKGPNARGGLVWKTHAFWKVSKTRKANARKKLRALNDVQSVLAHAAELQKAALGAAPK
jgi:hypothetical protein